jgi:predicted RNA-binding protein with PUA-like domain
MKTEPSTYSIDDLQRDKKTYWEGVRNYQARNFLRDQVQKGDGVLFYHSNANPPGIVGFARVSKGAYPDFTAWDPKNKYFDPKSKKENPTWYMVDLEFVDKLAQILSLDEIKKIPHLKDMMVLKKGMRLSVQPVDPKHYKILTKFTLKTKNPL